MVLPAVLLYSGREKPYFFPVFLRFVKKGPVSKREERFGTSSTANCSLFFKENSVLSGLCTGIMLTVAGCDSGIGGADSEVPRR
jgi:hypothetical protein